MGLPRRGGREGRGTRGEKGGRRGVKEKMKRKFGYEQENGEARPTRKSRGQKVGGEENGSERKER